MRWPSSRATRPALLVVPVGLVVAYGALRLSTSLFTELRELIFAKATEGTARSISLEVFRHLHGLSLRFHLERQTGGMTRDIERGTRAVHSLISYSLYSIFPTLIEVTLVLSLLAIKFDAWFAWITIAALVLYIAFTISVTEWRTQFRKEMNELDSKAHSRAIDSLLNYETVKYFNNEDFEARRYDENLEKLRRASLKSQSTLSLLNAGQQLIIAVALVAMLWRATLGVAEGRLTLGDLVMINAFMIQLYIPLNFLGVMYREIKQALTDLDKMFTLMDRNREVDDRPGAPELVVTQGAVRFEHVNFSYDPTRSILHDVSFEIPPGKTVAVVGPSGAGKSTLARLLYRFYDINSGAITIDGQELRSVTQSQPAPRHRHRAAGHRAVQRHGGIQHRLRSTRRHARRGGSRGACGAHPRLHRRHAHGLRHDGRRARASSSAVARSSAWPSRAPC
jgi:ABC-type transport system involved in Fe-S cluster assembly fused permease/ATPase subunit